MTPLRTASMKPTSKTGTVPVRRNCENGARGRGSPKALKSGMVARSPPKNKWVQQPGRQPTEYDRKQLDGETLHVAPQNIRRRAYRNPHPSGAAFGKIDGNLGAAVARTNNQHVLVAIRPWIAVIHRMNQRPIECARPSRQMWKAGIPGGHHDHPRGNRASGVRTLQLPSSRSMRVASIPNRGSSRW